MHPYRTPEPPPPPPRWRLHRSAVEAVAKLIAMYIVVQAIFWTCFWFDAVKAAEPIGLAFWYGMSAHFAWGSRIVLFTKENQ